MPKLIDPEIDAAQYGLNRAAMLEYLYWVDGRDSPDHPQHSLYTGLMDQYRYEFGRVALESLTRSWHVDRGVTIWMERQPEEGE